MPQPLVSQQKLTQAIKRAKAQLELDRAAGRPIGRSNLNRRVLDELEQTLAETRDGLAARERIRAGARDNAVKAGDTEKVAEIDALPAIHVPTSEELTDERQRLHREAVRVLAPIYLVQRQAEPTPATAPATPDTVVRAAPQLKASGGPIAAFKPTVLPPVHQIPNAAEGTLILGGSLALVAMGPILGRWVKNSVWDGQPAAVSGVPPQGAVSLALFIGVLVVAASLNDTLAQVTLWLVLALWAVFLVQHPDIVTTAANWLSQGTSSITAAQAPVGASTPTGPPDLHTGGPH